MIILGLFAFISAICTAFAWKYKMLNFAIYDEHDEPVPPPIVPPAAPQSLELPTSAPVQHQAAPSTLAAPPVDRVRLFALAQQAFEGWYPSSNSYRHNNPGNIKERNPDGSTSFITFKTYEEGFAALEAYILRVIAGKHPAYPKGPKTTIMEYTHTYTGDPEPAPTNYATALAKSVQLTINDKMEMLLG